MDFSKLFKGLAQRLLDAAMPAIKADLKQRIGLALGTSVPGLAGILVLERVNAAIDGWTIKL